MRSGFKVKNCHSGAVALAVLLSGLLFSCETMVDSLPLPSEEPQLVIQAYISPQDTLIRVYVTESIPINEEFSGRDFVIRDARVVMSGGGSEAELSYDSLYFAYTVSGSDMKIVPGATYRLMVEDETRQAYASTTVPAFDAPPFISYRIDTSYSDFNGGFSREDTSLVVQFQWSDPPESGNFYRVTGTARINSSFFEITEEGTIEERRGNFQLPISWDDSYGHSEFRSDVNRNGMAMDSPPGRIRINRPYTYYDEGIIYARHPILVTDISLGVLHTDEHYYRYHQSIRLNNDVSDNPFAEPALLYTNVNGGLGVFASFNSSYYRIKPISPR